MAFRAGSPIAMPAVDVPEITQTSITPPSLDRFHTYKYTKRTSVSPDSDEAARKHKPLASALWSAGSSSGSENQAPRSHKPDLTYELTLDARKGQTKLVDHLNFSPLFVIYLT